MTTKTQLPLQYFVQGAAVSTLSSRAPFIDHMQIQTGTRISNTDSAEIKTKRRETTLRAQCRRHKPTEALHGRRFRDPKMWKSATPKGVCCVMGRGGGGGGASRDQSRQISEKEKRPDPQRRRRPFCTPTRIWTTSGAMFHFSGVVILAWM